MAQENIIKWPFGDADSQAPASAAIISAEVRDRYTVIDISLAVDSTINLATTFVEQPTGKTLDIVHLVGDKILMKVLSDATARDVTYGTGFEAPLLAGVISKTNVQELVFDGTNFVPVALEVQID